MEGWQAGWPLHIFIVKRAFFDMTWNYQSHYVLQGDAHIMPVCSLHLCLHNKSECAQITWQIQKACQDKENILTATFKNETIVQDTCLDSQLLILLALKEVVTLLMTSVEAELNPAHCLGFPKVLLLTSGIHDNISGCSPSSSGRTVQGP